MTKADLSDDLTSKLIMDQALIGRVITQATSIEHMINAYVAEFYTRCPNADYQPIYLAFMYDLMNGRGISLDTKINILAKIYKRLLGDKNKLNKSLFKNWLKIRNMFAHGTYIGGKGILYGGEFFDVGEQAENHAEQQIRIHAELDKLSDLRGPYFSQFPTKKWEKKK